MIFHICVSRIPIDSDIVHGCSVAQLEVAVLGMVSCSIEFLENDQKLGRFLSQLM